MKLNLRVLSLGAGVQSSTLALLIEKGKVPMVNCAIFADTQAEPKEVYNWLEYLKTQIKSYPIHIVTWRNLKQDILDASEGNYKGFPAPFFTKNIKTNKKGLLMRQCTSDYKIKPVIKKIRDLLNVGHKKRVPKDTKVELLMGISSDETYRMKANRLPYIQNQYPLIDIKFTRQTCLNWLKQNNYDLAPRSACIFCPYHSNEEWSRIKNKNKEEWEEIVKIDTAIRNQNRFKKNNVGSDKLKDELYLHRDCKPINEIDFSTKKNNQMDFGFNNECEGMCGV
jgi:3'-phosphoadenosine 5'-phosphosulfate sulfotransferase (PAPS reductase)/FAD synthetase